MNKISPTLLVFLALITLPLFTQAQAIVDYYNLLADYDDDIKLHKIQEENGQWYSQAAFSNEKVKVTVDNNNNFLELKDKELDGIFTLQLALLKKSNGETLVAVVKNHMDIFLHGEIHILKMRNGRWNDITEEVMPDVTYKDFVEQTVSLAASAFNPQLNHHLEFGYQLPRGGNTALAKMQTQILKENISKN